MRRQLLYYAVALVLGTMLLFVGWQTFLVRTPTCSDGLRNGAELGVDCGGSCTKVCEVQTQPPRLLWSRAFPIASPLYTAVAYVQNPNNGAGARQVRYTFRLFDEQNHLVVTREGFADLPPLHVVPIFETNIDIGNRSVARTLFEFTSEPVWNKVPQSAIPTLRLSDQDLLSDGTRLSATLINDSLTDAKDITVVAVLFDKDDIARAASRTVVPLVARQSSEPIVFTWSAGVEGVARAEITILPSF